VRSPNVSVIIVSYNTQEKLERCLDCLVGTPKHESVHEVIVVDNASKDGSASMVETQFPQVQLIRATQNLGFGKANNLGADRATGDILLFLNSDAYADPQSVDQLAAAFDDSDIIAAGGRLLNPDRTLQESVAGRLTLGAVLLEQLFLDRLARPFGKSYWRTRLLPDEPVVVVDQVMGACLAVRRQSFPRFDPRFFLYCEDTELCARLSKHGKIAYVRDAVFVHELGSSSKASRWRAVARYNIGKETYFRIHHGALSKVICFALNRLGALLRVLVGLPGLLIGVIFGGPPQIIEKTSVFIPVLFATRRDVIPADYKPE
jgi:N-acetylglucosaminyl-diphospho-decaprenol L-rhamnosyltransferase